MAQRSMVSDARSSFPNTRQSHYRKTRYTNRLGSGFVRAPILILAVGEAHGWRGPAPTEGSVDAMPTKRSQLSRLGLGVKGRALPSSLRKEKWPCVVSWDTWDTWDTWDAAPILLEGLQR